MFAVTLICVGKLKEKFYLAASEEYAKRLRGYVDFTLIELPETRLPDDPSPAQITQGLAKEAELIRARIPKGAWFCVLTRGDAAVLGGAGGGAGLREGKRPERCVLPDRLVVRNGSEPQAAGGQEAFHVENDVPAPSGAGDGARAALSRRKHSGGNEIS